MVFIALLVGFFVGGCNSRILGGIIFAKDAVDKKGWGGVSCCAHTVNTAISFFIPLPPIHCKLSLNQLHMRKQLPFYSVWKKVVWQQFAFTYFQTTGNFSPAVQCNFCVQIDANHSSFSALVDIGQDRSRSSSFVRCWRSGAGARARRVRPPLARQLGSSSLSPWASSSTSPKLSWTAKPVLPSWPIWHNHHTNNYL